MLSRFTAFQQFITCFPAGGDFVEAGDPRLDSIALVNLLQVGLAARTSAEKNQN